MGCSFRPIRVVILKDSRDTECNSKISKESGTVRNVLSAMFRGIAQVTQILNQWLVNNEVMWYEQGFDR